MIWLLVIAYLLPALYTFRWIMGWVTCGRIDDWNEFMVGLMAGILVSPFWPILWGYRWGYRGWVRFGPEEKDMKVHLSRLFPDPPVLETKQERNERLLKEKEAEEARLAPTPRAHEYCDPGC
jgi:hypothetical protein